MKLIYTLVVCSGLLVNAKAQETATPLSLEKIIPLEKVEGRIDHMAADVAGQRLFVAALGNNTVEVVDLKAGKEIQSLTGFAEPQGIVHVPEFDRLFVANGSDGTCRILDGHSFKTISTVQMGDDADNVRYDEAAKRVYVGYGSGALGVLDAKTGVKRHQVGRTPRVLPSGNWRRKYICERAQGGTYRFGGSRERNRHRNMAAEGSKIQLPNDSG